MLYPDLPKVDKEGKKLGCGRRTSNWLNRQFDKHFFGIFLAAIKEGYLQVMIAGILYINMPKDLVSSKEQGKSWEYYHNNVVVIISLSMTLIIYPLFGLLVLGLRKSILHKRWARLRFGEIYDDIDLNRWSFRAYPLIYALRRMMLLVLIMWVAYLEGFQILVLMYLSLFVFVYVGVVRPFKLRFTNNQNLLNEYVIVTLTTYSVIFTDFCRVPNAQYNIGWMYLGVVLIYIICSFVVLLTPTFRSICLYSLKYYRIVDYWFKRCAGRKPAAAEDEEE